jgi:predicted nucleic-acid-binding protein
VWVLQRACRFSSTTTAAAVQMVIAGRNVEVDRPAAEVGLAMLRPMLRPMLGRGGDFAEGVIQHDARRARCRHGVTFERDLAERLGAEHAVLLDAARS